MPTAPRLRNMTFAALVAVSVKRLLRPSVGRGVLAVLIGLLALSPLGPQTPADARPGVANPSTRALGAGSRITWQGRSWYLHGANVPWLNWAGDFGGGTNNGVKSAASQTALKAAFQQAKDSGVTNIRWWVFEGDPW